MLVSGGARARDTVGEDGVGAVGACELQEGSAVVVVQPYVVGVALAQTLVSGGGGGEIAGLTELRGEGVAEEGVVGGVGEEGADLGESVVHGLRS